MDRKFLLELTADIVSAHVSVNEMGPDKLLEEVQSVFRMLETLSGAESTEVEVAGQEIKPAIPVNKAFGTDKVYCLVVARRSPR